MSVKKCNNPQIFNEWAHTNSPRKRSKSPGRENFHKMETINGCKNNKSKKGHRNSNDVNTKDSKTSNSSDLNSSESLSTSTSSISNKFLKQETFSTIPNEIRERLHSIFGQIEFEFEILYKENSYLREQLNKHEKTNNDELLSIYNNETTKNSSTTTLVGTNSINSNFNLNTELKNKYVYDETNRLDNLKVRHDTSSFKDDIIKDNNKLKNRRDIFKNYQFSSLRSSVTSSAVTALASTSSSAKSALISSKTRINNLSFPKFKPNAREFIIQSFKNTSSQIVNRSQSLCNTRLETNLVGHKDGINDINCVSIPFDLLSQNNNLKESTNNFNLIIGSASVDTTARLWYLNRHLSHNQTTNNTQSSPSNQCNPIYTYFCFQEYCGHLGSVNSIRFHPKFFSDATNLILTASGDSEAHIWQSVLSPHNHNLLNNSDMNLNYNTCFSIAMNNLAVNSNSLISSPQSNWQNHSQNCSANGHQDNVFAQNNDLPNSNSKYLNLISSPSSIRSPLKRYQGHTDACIAAEWFPDGEQIVTGSWDRTANVYNVETSKIMCNLQHDDYLTNVAIHKTQKIILTSSKDTTFKVWDFRDPICSVQIYQGHNRSVNSAIFVGDDKIATSSDDNHCKLWDLRVMRSPVFSINMNSSINRICTMNPNLDSSSNDSTYLCIPLDSREIKIYNLQGERILRLPRNNRIGHSRPVTSLASHGTLLLSASHDKLINCWSFDYNPPKILNNKLFNKENNETVNYIEQSTLKNDMEKNSDSPLRAQLNEGLSVTTPSSQQQLPLNHITNNNSNKNINALSKLTEKIKI